MRLRESLPRGAGVALIDFVSAFDSLLHGAIEATLRHLRWDALIRPLLNFLRSPVLLPHGGVVLPARGVPQRCPPQPHPLQLRPRAAPPLPPHRRPLRR
jgi:hypothetical protein